MTQDGHSFAKMKSTTCIHWGGGGGGGRKRAVKMMEENERYVHLLCIQWTSIFKAHVCIASVSMIV